MNSAKRRINWVVGYYDKDGSSFMNTGEPWLVGDIESKQEAEARAKEMIAEGYMNVQVAPVNKINQLYVINN